MPDARGKIAEGSVSGSYFTVSVSFIVTVPPCCDPVTTSV
jgi:hypothetical protein